MNKGIILGIVGIIIVTGIGAAGAILAVNSSGSINNNVPQNVEPTKEKVTLNGWKEESGSWYFYKNNEKQKNWVQDKNSWYFLGTDGKLRTGWIKDNETWYYLNKDGSMATNTTIDNCYLNEKGIIENTPTNNKPSVNTDTSANASKSKYVVNSFEQARQIVLREDGAHLQKITDPGTYIQLDSYKQETIGNEADNYGIPNEECFSLLIEEYDKGNPEFEYGMYLVGRETGNVYILPHQGCFSAYQIKNNKVARRFRWPGPDEDPSPDWR